MDHDQLELLLYRFKVAAQQLKNTPDDEGYDRLVRSGGVLVPNEYEAGMAAVAGTPRGKAAAELSAASFAVVDRYLSDEAARPSVRRFIEDQNLGAKLLTSVRERVWGTPDQRMLERVIAANLAVDWGVDYYQDLEFPGICGWFASAGFDVGETLRRIALMSSDVPSGPEVDAASTRQYLTEFSEKNVVSGSGPTGLIGRFSRRDVRRAMGWGHMQIDF